MKKKLAKEKVGHLVHKARVEYGGWYIVADSSGYGADAGYGGGDQQGRTCHSMLSARYQSWIEKLPFEP